MEAIENNTKEILNHHLTAFGNNNMEEIMKDYSEESEVLSQEGLLKGLSSIQAFFEKLFIIIPTGSFFEMKQLIVSGKAAYIVWASESNTSHIPFGTDSFFIEGGKIRLHTVAAHISGKVEMQFYPYA